MMISEALPLRIPQARSADFSEELGTIAFEHEKFLVLYNTASKHRMHDLDGFGVLARMIQSRRRARGGFHQLHNRKTVGWLERCR